MSVVALVGLSACGGDGGTDGDASSQPEIPLSHTIELPTESGPGVFDIRDENGDLTAIKVGDTGVLLSQKIASVSGGGGRETVGPVLQHEDIIVRHIDSHWNLQTDAVAKFDHMSYGVWATGTVERPQGGATKYTFESVGSPYLTALDDSRTSAADMPMPGTATYLGQVTGFVQAYGVGGDIRHYTGDVKMTADFSNAEMTVDMRTTRGTNIVLGGTIQGNEFSGNTIHQMPDTRFLQAQGATAELAGGFYGQGAVEAGGVFEIVGGRTQDPGRVVGAFGGRKAE